MILRQKLRNLTLIQSEDFFLVFILESHTIFSNIRKILKIMIREKVKKFGQN